MGKRRDYTPGQKKALAVLEERLAGSGLPARVNDLLAVCETRRIELGWTYAEVGRRSAVAGVYLDRSAVSKALRFLECSDYTLGALCTVFEVDGVEGLRADTLRNALCLEISANLRRTAEYAARLTKVG